MAIGIKSGGVDLDALFATRVSAKRADVGYRAAGVDISNRFETIGASTPIANTGLKSAGVDLAQLFKGIGGVLSASVAPTSAGGSCNRSTVGNCTVTTTSVTVTPAGGTPPYSYAWELVSGSGANETAFNNPVTAFTRAGAAQNPTNTLIGAMRCKVTDNLGAIAYTANVTITTNHTLSA